MVRENVLWTSKKWKAGNTREIPAGKFDPEDNVLQFGKAGGDSPGRKCTIDGQGNLFLSGHQTRIFPHISNTNSELEFYCMVTDERLASISTKSRSRHNEGGSKSNRFGGYGCSFDFEKQRISWKIEYYHNVHSRGVNKDLEKRLKLGMEYGFKTQLQTKEDGSAVIHKAFIKYPDENEWTSVGQVKWTEANWDTDEEDDTFHKPVLDEGKYFWIRINAKDDSSFAQDVRFSNVTIRDLDPID